MTLVSGTETSLLSCLGVEFIPTSLEYLLRQNSVEDWEYVHFSTPPDTAGMHPYGDGVVRCASGSETRKISALECDGLMRNHLNV